MAPTVPARIRRAVLTRSVRLVLQHAVFAALVDVIALAAHAGALLRVLLVVIVLAAHQLVHACRK
jgi:hypothetical protein